MTNTPQPITPDTNDGPSRGQRLVKFISGLSLWNLHRGEEALNEYMLDTFMELIGEDEPMIYHIGDYTYGDSPYDSATVTYGRNELRAELRKATQERFRTTDSLNNDSGGK